MKGIYTVVGARPNFIKLDPKLPQTIIHTGQHWNKGMSDVFFDELKLPKPKYNLGLRSEDTGLMIDRLREIFRKDKPKIVLVFGDTNSSLAGAMAAYYENIPIVHVEAGLRSGNSLMPEEKSRIIIDRIAKVKLCPNDYAVKNLYSEGIKDDIHIVGDPMFDAINAFLPIKPTKKRYILATIHRDFNTDSGYRLTEILSALQYCGDKVILPIHPRLKSMLSSSEKKLFSNIKFIPPQPYKKMLYLEANALKVVTDSGGVQREAFWFNRPVIILREETEWREIIGKGAGILVGYNREKIIDAIKNFQGAIVPPPEYGANEKIRNILYRYL